MENDKKTDRTSMTTNTFIDNNKCWHYFEKKKMNPFICHVPYKVLMEYITSPLILNNHRVMTCVVDVYNMTMIQHQNEHFS